MSDMARRLAERGQQKRGELVGSVKMGRELRVESNIEATGGIALDIHPRVTALHAQPFSVRLDLLRQFPTKKLALAAYPPVPPRSKRVEPDDDFVYTPDFLAEGNRGAQLAIEFTSADKLEKKAAKLPQWRRALAALGYPFQCFTNLDLVEPGTSGADTKRALGATRFNLVCVRDARRAVLREGIGGLAPLMDFVRNWQSVLTVAVLRARFADHLIQQAIAAGVLGCDLKAGALGPNTVLWAADGDLSHLCLLELEL